MEIEKQKRINENYPKLLAALGDCINLFNDSDKSPDHKSLICTGDRREMWDRVLSDAKEAYL